MNNTCDNARLDAALDLGALESERAWATRHTASCLPCHRYTEQRHQLDAELALLPKEMLPSRPLWSEVAERLALPASDIVARAAVGPSRSTMTSHCRTPHRASIWRVAAAATLFAGGFGAGTATMWWRSARTSPPATERIQNAVDPSQPAEEVQRLGSALTASLARLGQTETVSQGTRNQEREVALATLRGAVAELMRIAPNQPGVARAYAALRDAHRNADAPISTVRTEAMHAVPF